MGRINYRNAKKIAYYILGVGIILTVLSIPAMWNHYPIITPVVLAIFALAYIGFVFRYYRCPYCGATFPMHKVIPAYCPYCEVDLED